MAKLAPHAPPRAGELAPAPPLEDWLADELARAPYHLDGFTWLLDPPRDEDAKIPQMGDVA